MRTAVRARTAGAWLAPGAPMGRLRGHPIGRRLLVGAFGAVALLLGAWLVSVLDSARAGLLGTLNQPGSLLLAGGAFGLGGLIYVGWGNSSLRNSGTVLFVASVGAAAAILLVQFGWIGGSF